MVRLSTTMHHSLPKIMMMKFMEKTVTLMPENVEAWVELGNIRLKLQDKAGALSAFEKALSLEPDASGLKEYVEKLRR